MKKKTLRKMKDISLDERKQILLEMQVESREVVAQRHSTTYNVLHHIKFFHGSIKGANKRYYHKDLLGGAENPLVGRVRELKKNELNSVEIARKLGIDVGLVNRVWLEA